MVDNTNPRRADRAPLVEMGRRHGARTIAVHFLASVGEALGRNRAREGTARVPDVAICEACQDGACDDCTNSAWSEAVAFPTTCDCRETGHALQDDIAQDQADDRILGAYYEENR